MKSKSQGKISMPDYSKVGFSAEHNRSPKSQDRNQITAPMGGQKINRLGTPPAQYRVESHEGNRKPPADQKIRDMPPVTHSVSGQPCPLPAGKMRNEKQEKDCY